MSTLVDATGKLVVYRGDAEVDHGTGFVVGARFVLSAFHVVAERFEPFAPSGDRFVLALPKRSPVELRRVDDAGDPHADWVLLESTEDLGVAPLVAWPCARRRLPFEARGYPLLDSTNGMTIPGQVVETAGTVEGAPALQLHALSAAAPGAYIQGLSGGPVIVDDRVVGIVRAVPTRVEDDTAAGGVVYACPIQEVLRHPVAAPCVASNAEAGLPPLPDDIGVPKAPYRRLLPYGRVEARVFFGRGATIQEIIRSIEDPSAPLTFLSGQSGVGKSSVLRAGVLPRLEASRSVAIEARSREEGLVGSFERAVERIGDAPPLIVVDQVEEAYTRPREHPDAEVDDLMFAIRRYLEDVPPAQVMLVFRKEWLGDLEAAADRWSLPYMNAYVRRLAQPDIEAVVNGPTRDFRLAKHFHLKIDSDLAPVIAVDLTTDPDSPIAPTLQVILTELYDAAERVSKSEPHMRVADYRTLVRGGSNLEAFVDRQLASLPPAVRAAGDDGLILDVLEFHTTDLGTAETRTEDEIAARYDGAEALVDGLRDAYLLTDPRDDGAGQSRRTRLAHDTIAPIVRRRFQDSLKLGQQARRILETAALDWRNGTTGEALTQRALGIVQGGLRSMRRLHPDEQRLVDASRAKKKRTSALITVGLLVFVATVYVVATLYKGRRDADMRFGVEIAMKQFDAALWQYEDSADPEPALEEVVAATAKWRVANPAQDLIARAVLFALESPAIVQELAVPGTTLATHVGAQRIVAVETNQGIWAAEATLDRAARRLVIAGPTALVREPRSEPNTRIDASGRWLASFGRDELQVFDLGTQKLAYQGEEAGFRFVGTSALFADPFEPGQSTGPALRSRAFIAHDGDEWRPTKALDGSLLGVESGRALWARPLAGPTRAVRADAARDEDPDRRFELKWTSTRDTKVGVDAAGTTIIDFAPLAFDAANRRLVVLDVSNTRLGIYTLDVNRTRWLNENQITDAEWAPNGSILARHPVDPVVHPRVAERLDDVRTTVARCAARPQWWHDRGEDVLACDDVLITSEGEAQGLPRVTGFVGTGLLDASAALIMGFDDRARVWPLDGWFRGRVVGRVDRTIQEAVFDARRSAVLATSATHAVRLEGDDVKRVPVEVIDLMGMAGWSARDATGPFELDGATMARRPYAGPRRRSNLHRGEDGVLRATSTRPLGDLFRWTDDGWIRTRSDVHGELTWSVDGGWVCWSSSNGKLGHADSPTTMKLGPLQELVELLLPKSRVKTATAAAIAWSVDLETTTGAPVHLERFDGGGWTARSGTIPLELPSVDAPMRAAALSRDGRLMIVAFGRHARVYRTGRHWLSPPLPHPGDVLDVTFVERNGATFARSIAADGVLREWYIEEPWDRAPEWLELLPLATSDPAMRRRLLELLDADPREGARWLARHFRLDGIPPP
ncbi:MAG: serine protease [Deltaproteobacteria bacterium]